MAIARCLHACETVSSEAPAPAGSAALRVHEKLRRRLSALAGVAGFQLLASRALTLARSEAPGLRAVQITADGHLHGMAESGPETGKDQVEEGGVIFTARLMELLFTFIGKSLTVRLLQDVWPDVDFEGEKRERTK